MEVNEVPKVFEKAGLTDYQSQIISVLLKNSNMTAKGISEESSVPYTKIYSVLKTLENKGYIRSSLERPKKYSVLDPEDLKSKILENKREEIDALEEELDSELERIKSMGSRDDYLEEMPVWFLPSRDAITAELISVPSKTEEEFLAVIFTAWKNIGSSEEFLSSLEDMGGKGVEMKMILPSSVDPGCKEIQNLYSKGVSIKLVDPGSISYSLVISDRCRCGLTIKRDPSAKSRKGIRINSESIADTLYMYFKDLWDEGNSVDFS